MLKTVIFAMILIITTSCARRWEIYRKDENLNYSKEENSQSLSEQKIDPLKESKYVGQIEYASNKEYILCYLTVTFFGGYCWYMRYGAPNSSDIDEVKREAVLAYPEFDLKKDEIFVRPR